MTAVKKQEQLGMNPSTAANRLVKDVLWSLVVKTGQDSCCKCGEKMTRENYSIEHKTPWLDSENPIELYFDLDNISFSHHACNVGDSRRPTAQHGSAAMYNKYGCRCEPCKAADAAKRAGRYSPEKRKAKYQRSGH
jgi:hypothetical protein